MSKWYSFKELKRARTPMLLDSVTGLPDNHVITVVERVISVDDPELIQNNVRTDTFTLNLDAEYDDLNVVVIFTKPNNINVKVAYNGTPTHIPGSAMELVGSLACSVVGIDADGEVRAVTKAAPDTFQVVKSGAYDGSVTSDDVELLGQILQAVSDAETATTEAETATTAATNATNQATSAATSANQAASSANTAASSANSAATRATSAAVNAENAYETLQPYMATIDSCANILHREVGPDTVVTADDSFPAKPVEMVVYGNTVQNLWVNPSGTYAGVTVTSNEDGSMTISGTNSTSNDVYFSSGVITAIPYGKQLTVSSSNYGESGKWRLVLDGIGGGTITEQKTFLAEWSSENAGLVSVVVTPGTTVNATIRVMLNEGSTAEPWCPPGLNSVGEGGSVKVVTAGKNLLKFRDNLQPVTMNGLTFTPNEDGTVTVNGTATANDTDYYIVGTSWAVRADANLPASDLVFSSNGNAKMYGYDSDGAQVISTIVNNGQGQIAASEAQACAKVVVYLSYASGKGESNKRVYVQLELGSTATAYEPPNITTTPIDLDGNTLCSLPDGTHDELTIDATGAVTLVKRVGVFEATEGTSWTEYGGQGNVNAYYTKTGMSAHSPTGDAVNAVDTKMMCDDFPCYQALWDDNVAIPCVGMSNNATYLNAMFYNSAGYGPAASDTRMTVLYPLAEPQTIDLGTITPPTMAAPNVTAYVADDTPAEMELDYVRDINIVVDRLEKKVADLVVTEATIV